MFEDLTISTEIFTARHLADVRAVFEPVSGIMFLNATDQEFAEMRASEGVEHQDLWETFWHESYHCLQVYSTGYLYAQSDDLLNAFLRGLHSESGFVFRNVMPRYLLGKVKNLARFWMPRDLRIRIARSESLLFEYERLMAIQKRATAFGQTTVAGALMPQLYTSIDAVRCPSTVRGIEGLSAQDVIEGSAYIYGKAITEGTVGLRARLSDKTIDANGPYRQLMTVGDQIAPGCTLEMLLAASALALRYEHPGEAYVPVLRLLSAAGPGEEVTTAKHLSRDLPHVAAAGRQLGTAKDVHQQRGIRNRTYEDQLVNLTDGTWGVDEIDLLVDTEAIASIPVGHLGFGVVTLDGGRRGFADTAEMGFKLFIGTSMLSTGPSIAQRRRRFETEFSGYVGDLIGRNRGHHR